MIKKRSRKKAMGIEDAAMLLYRLVFLALAMFVFILFAGSILNPFPDISEPKAEILLGRVLYSEAIHYKDANPGASNRVYTSIIDVDKLVDYNLTGSNDLNINNEPFPNKLAEYFNQEFYNPLRENLFVFSLKVEFINKSTNLKEEKIFFSNEDQFMLLAPKKTKKGKGSVQSIERTFSTNCLIEEQIIPCEATISLLLPRS